MQTRRLGRSDLLVSAITLGTMTFGEQNTEAEGHAQMDRAFAAGVTLFDAAEMYPIPPKPQTAGRTEEIVGSWMRSRRAAGKVAVATKAVGRTVMDWLRADGSPGRLTRPQITEAVETSLRRLGTETIDLYQIHWPDRDVPGFGSNPTRWTRVERAADENAIEETAGVFADLVGAGKIRRLGLSNESAWGTMRWIAAAERGLGPRVVSIQNAYNLVNRTFETALAEVCDREEIGLLAYSPLAQGYLTGKYRDGVLPHGARKTLFDRLQRYEKPGAAEAVAAYCDLSRDFGLDPAVFAIAFALNQSCVASTIIGATTLPQLDACLSATGVTWTREMQAAVDAVHQRVGNPCP